MLYEHIKSWTWFVILDIEQLFRFFKHSCGEWTCFYHQIIWGVGGGGTLLPWTSGKETVLTSWSPEDRNSSQSVGFLSHYDGNIHFSNCHIYDDTSSSQACRLSMRKEVGGLKIQEACTTYLICFSTQWFFIFRIFCL